MLSLFLCHFSASNKCTTLFADHMFIHKNNFSCISVFCQLCQVLSPTTMLCQAPELPISLARQQEVPERPDEFGFKLDDVQALMALNNTNFIYYPNPEFEPLSVSGVLELKPGSPIILKVRGYILFTLTYNQCLLIVKLLTFTGIVLYYILHDHCLHITKLSNRAILIKLLLKTSR